MRYLKPIKADITTLSLDAIVNAANPSLLGGGGVDGAIHAAAGNELRDACRKLGGCKPGEAKITPGFRLPVRYVIHTVGPIWHGGDHQEAMQLTQCYRHSLDIAQEHALASIAFPAISCGAYGYPAAEAVPLAVRTTADWLEQTAYTLSVYFVAMDEPLYRLYQDACHCYQS